MSIYQPTLILSEADKEILTLLGQLVLASDFSESSNLSRDNVALSPTEADRLLVLLEQFSNSKLFIEGSYFAEKLAIGGMDLDKRLKDIYFSWRSRRGRINISSNQRWSEFTLRSGFYTSGDAWMWPKDIRRSPIRPMTLEHFLAMEVKLASAAKLSPRVQQLIIKFVASSLPRLNDVRERRLIIPAGSIEIFVRSFISDLSDHVFGREKSPMSRKRVVALSTLVMDTAALFATRDWTATGVISSIAAVIPDALTD